MEKNQYTDQQIQQMLDELSKTKIGKRSDDFLLSVEERKNKGVYKEISQKMKNRVVSSETSQKISKSKKGTILSDETKKKLKNIAKETKQYLKAAEVWSNKPEEYRKEVGKKSGESRLGRKATNEHKQNISNSLKGISKSEEHRKKLSESKKGIKVSDETKKKLIEAANVEYTCVHCNSKVKGAGNLSRWHNDNCKKKPII